MARTTSPRTTQPGSPDQKWLHDYLVNVTGRPTNFEVPGRAFPASVKSYAMAPKHMARQARQSRAMVTPSRGVWAPVLRLRAMLSQALVRGAALPPAP